ncbi:MAG: IPT/TIG domain-containing protein [Polyangiales bacterium]
MRHPTALTLLALTSLPAAVWAQPRPMVERIQPASGAAGTRVRIVGRGFTRAYRVSFNGRELRPVEVLPERVTVVVPEGAQTGPFLLSHGDDELQTEPFTVSAPSPAPVIRALEPPSAVPGADVVLRGENFAARPTDNTVLVGGRPAVVQAAEPTMLRVTVPVGAVSGPVVVRTSGGEARSESELVVGARVAIRELSTLAVSPGGRIVLRGNGFAATAAANRVTLGGRPLRVVRASAGELEVEVPLNAQSGNVAVDVARVGRFEYPRRLFVGAAPTITSVSPPQGAPGGRIRIVGTGFGTDASRVTASLGGRDMTVASVTPTEIVATIPRGAVNARIEVTAGGIGPVATATEYMILEPLTLTRFEPRAGDVGDQITLSGTGFASDPAQNTVRLGTAEARVVSATSSALVVEVPQSRSGLWSVSVAGSGEARARAPFMVSMRPRITAMEPAIGIPGSRVVLRGTNFPSDRALATVRLNGQDVAVQEYTREAITVTVPANAQTGRFEIIGRLQGTGRAEADFVVVQPVTLTAVDPPAGPVGATITLRGSGFEPDPARLRVRLGELLVRPERSSTTEAVFRVPRRARDGALVIEADGRQTVQAPEVFRVTLPPAVTSVSPPRAPPGATITLRGRNFGADPAAVEVSVGGQPCAVASAT